MYEVKFVEGLAKFLINLSACASVQGEVSEILKKNLKKKQDCLVECKYGFNCLCRCFLRSVTGYVFIGKD